MLKNHNQEVVSRMAKRSLRSNLRRSITMILAVMLSSFLLFSVFTVGVTYMKMQKVQNIRLNGADFDAILYGMTEEQQKMIENDPDVEKIGIVALCGYVEKTAYDSTPDAVFAYADETCWNEMMAPARESLTGKYPTKENEVMVCEKALEKCGFTDVGIGDSITFTYAAKGNLMEKTLRISGIWEGYGDHSLLYVSKQFYEKSGYTYDEAGSGRCHITFQKKLMLKKEQQEFIDQLHLNKAQRLYFLSEYGNAMQILTGLIGIILVTCLCAYLLIYNIMYLSVVGNIRYYGLLQTVGMTGKQIYQLMRRQLLLIGCIGAVVGIAIGAGVSFVLVPVVLRSLGIRSGKIEDVTITFHPVIILLTIILIGITVWTAGRKPTKIAVSCSPVEALGYHPVSGLKKSRKTGKGTVTGRLAKEQLTRNKKKTTVVMISLAASLSVFLCMTTLLHSQAAREFYYNLMDFDIVIKNDTLQNQSFEKDQIGGMCPILNDEILGQIRDVEGVTEVLSAAFSPIIVPWEPEVTDLWMREFYETWMEIPYEDEIEEYKAHPENFGSSITGITEADFRAINAESEHPVDEEAFLSGQTCLLYRNGLMEIQDSDLQGKEIRCAEYNNRANSRSFEIAGLTDAGGYTALLGYPPTIIVIDHALEAFVEEPIVFQAGIRYNEEYSRKTEDAVLAVLKESSDFKDYSWDSKIETAENVKEAQGYMMEIGIGIVLILAFIGIMNYVNTTVGNIQSRQKEIAIMESIGMTSRQVKKMLVLEGIFYAMGTLILTVTVGMGVTYFLYQSMNYRKVAFQFPVLPFLGAVVLMVLVCAAVPVLAYREMEKRGSLVERIRVMTE